jgi:uncharacterized protein
MTEEKPKRGFAAISPERQREIAGMGGRAAHAKGVAHKWTAEEAVAAGKIGGAVAAKIPGRMAEIGRIGGRSRGARMRDRFPSTDTES